MAGQASRETDSILEAAAAAAEMKSFTRWKEERNICVDVFVALCEDASASVGRDSCNVDTEGHVAVVWGGAAAAAAALQFTETVYRLRHLNNE